jgi:hypothetical protein
LLPQFGEALFESGDLLAQRRDINGLRIRRHARLPEFGDLPFQPGDFRRDIHARLGHPAAARLVVGALGVSERQNAGAVECIKPAPATAPPIRPAVKSAAKEVRRLAGASAAEVTPDLSA